MSPSLASQLHSPSNKTADLLRPARQRAKSRTGNPWGTAKNTTQEQKQQFSWIHAATASRLLLTAWRMERSCFSTSYADSCSELQPPHTFQDLPWISPLRSALFHCSVDEDVFSWPGDWRRHAGSKVIYHRHECMKEACGTKQSFVLTGFICFFFNTGGEWMCMRVYWNQNVHVCTFITMF